MEQFIPFIKAVGRGEKLKRDLTRDEAQEAMRLILTEQATPAQVGAFLVAQRVKGESTNEVAGFSHMNYLQRMRGAPCQPNPQGWIVQGPEGSIECPPGSCYSWATRFPIWKPALRWLARRWSVGRHHWNAPSSGAWLRHCGFRNCLGRR